MSEIDTKRAWLIPYLQGWGWKLDECCSGLHVHRKAQARQALTTWLQILQRPDCSLDQVMKIEELAPKVINQARAVYLEHLKIKEAESKKGYEADS